MSSARRRKCRSHAGFSFAEILIAMAVLGFVVLGVVWFEQQRWRNLSRADFRTRALRAVQQRIEDKRISALTGNWPPTSSSSSTQDGITMRDSIGARIGMFGETVDSVRSLTVWATWPGSRDTVKVQAAVARNF